MFAPHVLTVTVFEVGKGDAALMRSPRGKTLLIDTGPDAGILRALGNALPEWQRDIDAAIITGSAAGSAGGLSDIKNRYHISHLLYFGAPGKRNLGTLPYGSQLTFDKNISIAIIAPSVFTISYGATTLLISSSTPPGAFISDGTDLHRQ